MKQGAAGKAVDVVIVGAGMAGLAAAHALRHLRVVVLEAADRPGGRLLSQPVGRYWLNFGAHMFGPPDSPVGRLLDATGVAAGAINGRLMGMAYKGKRLFDVPAEAYPLRLPLSLGERASLIKMGLRLRVGSSRLAALMRPRPGEPPAARRQRLLGIENDRTLADYVGGLGGETRALLRAITERNGADPEDMSAGHGLRSFGNVWSRHAPGRNVIGGSSRLPEALAASLGTAVRYGADVLSIDQDAAGVTVTHCSAGAVKTTTRARACIVATPAHVARRVIGNLPEAVAAALEGIRYGAFVTAGVLTREPGAMAWDRTYATATPGRSFSVMFNMATTLRTAVREPGGSLMLFRGARGAADLLDISDDAIAARFAADLVDAFPELKGLIDHIIVQKWPFGAPFSAVGRARLQPVLAAPIGHIVLAGDYLEFPNMEAAVMTGEEAAASVAARLATTRQDTL